MKKTQGYTKQLDEHIYIICFKKPRYIKEIQQALQNNNITHTSHIKGEKGKIQELINKGWLQYQEHPPTIFLDARYYLRKYYYSPINPLITKITEQIKLSTKETRTLTKLLDTKAFRSLVTYNESYHTISDLYNLIVKLVIGVEISQIHVRKHLHPRFQKMNEKQWLQYYDKRINKILSVFNSLQKILRKEIKQNKLSDTRQDIPKKDFQPIMKFCLRALYTDKKLLQKLKKLPHNSEIKDISHMIYPAMLKYAENQK